MSDSPHDVTGILRRIEGGDTEAARQLLAVLYDELRTLAVAQFRGQPAGHTLQPTILVHEAFLRLAGKPAGTWKDRRHFFAVAATAMRQILVSHARARNAGKRGGGATRLQLDGQLDGAPNRSLDAIELDEVLRNLAAVDERRHRIVELRFFGGLEMAEIADLLGVSLSTVEAEWRGARAYLRVHLAG